MAKFRATALAQDLQGKIGNQSFQLWKTGVNTVKGYSATPAQPNSEKQQVYQVATSFLVSRWFTILSGPQRAGWEQLAKSKPNSGPSNGGSLQIIKGNTGLGTGYHAFMSLNGAKASAGQDVINNPIDDAPLGQPIPMPITDFAVVWDMMFLQFVFSWTAQPDLSPTKLVRIWIKDPKQLIHPQILCIPSEAASPYASTEQPTGHGGVTVPYSSLGSQYLFRFQADVVDIGTGLISQPTETIESKCN